MAHSAAEKAASWQRPAPKGNSYAKHSDSRFDKGLEDFTWGLDTKPSVQTPEELTDCIVQYDRLRDKTRKEKNPERQKKCADRLQIIKDKRVDGRKRLGMGSKHARARFD